MSPAASAGTGLAAPVPSLSLPVAPEPLLDPERERALTERQRELLAQLELVVNDGFDKLTMSELASRLSCSLRTLYELAPSRDELVLLVLDRSLWRIGRDAQAAIDTATDPLDAVRAYLHATNVAVAAWTEPFARDIEAVPSARRLAKGHNDYLFGVTKALLDQAAATGQIAVDIDTAAVAQAISVLGRFYFQPSVRATIDSSPKAAADQLIDLVLDGLRRTATTDASHRRASR